MLRSLLSARLLPSHVLVLTVAVVCVLLGQWQFDRLAEVRDHNARLEARYAAPPLTLDTVDVSAASSGDLQFRRFTASGTFRPEQEVLHRNRDHHGAQGFHILTPLVTHEGPVILVRRGWVPREHDSPPVTEAPPPEGEVTVSGFLEQPVGQPGFGPRDPDEGHLQRVFHADLDRLEGQITGELFPMVLHLEELQPASGHPLPLPAPRPVLNEANHLSYAVQWHTFALIALGAYGAWLWKRSQRLQAEARAKDPVPAA